MKPLRVVVIGLGIGQAHIKAYKALADRFEVVGVCSLEPDVSRKVADEQGIPRVFLNYKEVLGRHDVDVVDLCTPPYLHFDQVCQALRAGMHVIVEKPHAGSLREIDELIALEKSSGRRVMPIFQYRFGNGLQKLKALKEQKLTGKAYLTTVEVMWRRRKEYYANPWRGKLATELGGALTSQAIHALDMMMYILGGVKSVFARTRTLVNLVEVEDNLGIVLEMADGSLATLAVTLGSGEEITRHRFCFQNLVAESNTRPYDSFCEPWSFYPDKPESASTILKALDRYKPDLEGFEGQFARFYRALAGKEALPVDLKSARAALEVVTAIYTSAQLGVPIELPIAAEDPVYQGWRGTSTISMMKE